MLTKAQAGGPEAAAAHPQAMRGLSCRPARRRAAARAGIAHGDGREPVAARPDALAAASADHRPRRGPASAPGTRWCRAARAQMPGQHGTFRDCIARLPDIAAMGFDVLYFTPIHPIGSTNRKGRNNCAGRRARRSRQPLCDRRRRRRPRRAASGTRHARGFPRAGRGLPGARHGGRARLRRAVLAGSPLAHATIRNGSSGGRTARCAMRRTRRRNTRTSSIPISAPRTRERCGTRCATCVLFWIDQGVTIFRIDNPHTKPLPFWEWLIREVQPPPSRRAVPRRSLHAAETDEGPRQARLHAVLHLFHLAHREAGARAVSRRADRLSRARLLSAELLRQHAGHPALSSAGRRSLDVQVAPRAGGRRCRPPTASTAASSCWSTTPIPGRKNISTPRSTRSGRATGTSPATSSPISPRSTARAATTRRCSRPRICASSRSRTARRDRLRQGGGRPHQHGRRRHRAVGPGARSLAAARRRQVTVDGGDAATSRHSKTSSPANVHRVEWGGIRLRIDPERDPALLFRCLA